ncbi:MAG: Ig-like domain-containing protein [Patescibacteria group bacterium]
MKKTTVFFYLLFAIFTTASCSEDGGDSPSEGVPVESPQPIPPQPVPDTTPVPPTPTPVPINTPPQVSLAQQVVQPETLTKLLINVFDKEGNFSYLGIKSAPINGSVELSQDRQSISYISNPGYTGDDSLIFIVTDSMGSSTEATADVRVLPKVLLPTYINPSNYGTVIFQADNIIDIEVNDDKFNDGLDRNYVVLFWGGKSYTARYVESFSPGYQQYIKEVATSQINMGFQVVFQDSLEHSYYIFNNGIYRYMDWDRAWFVLNTPFTAKGHHWDKADPSAIYIANGDTPTFGVFNAGILNVDPWQVINIDLSLNGCYGYTINKDLDGLSVHVMFNCSSGFYHALYDVATGVFVSVVKVFDDLASLDRYRYDKLHFRNGCIYLPFHRKPSYLGVVNSCDQGLTWTLTEVSATNSGNSKSAVWMNDTTFDIYTVESSEEFAGYHIGVKYPYDSILGSWGSKIPVTDTFFHPFSENNGDVTFSFIRGFYFAVSNGGQRIPTYPGEIVEAAVLAPLYFNVPLK